MIKAALLNPLCASPLFAFFHPFIAKTKEIIDKIQAIKSDTNTVQGIIKAIPDPNEKLMIDINCNAPTDKPNPNALGVWFCSFSFCCCI